MKGSQEKLKQQDIFWHYMAEEFAKKKPEHGHPSKLSKLAIETFLVDLELRLEEICSKKPQLKKLLKSREEDHLSYQIIQWRTFIKIFREKSIKLPRVRTANAFAIYFGYDSAIDFIEKYGFESKYGKNKNYQKGIQEGNKYPKCRFEHKSKNCYYQEIYTSLEKVLPIDESGFCLFHSENLEWKSKYNFQDQLEILINHFSQADEDKVQVIDLRFIIFPVGGYEKLWINRKYKHRLDFSGCTFNSPVLIYDCEFSSVDFSGAEFKQKVSLKHSQFAQLVYSKGAIYHRGFYISDCQFENSVFFDKCKFNNKADNKTVLLKIKNTKFKYPIDFSETSFDLGVFLNNVILDEIDFSECIFHKEFFIDTASISKPILFQQTEFLCTDYIAGYMSTVDFKHLHLLEAGKMVFQGKYPFHDQVRGEISLELEEGSTGTILIENFNLNKFENNSKKRLFDLEKKGRVEIGKGCRKYHHQTPPKKIIIQQGNQSLVTELTNTFTEFFKTQNGINLGVEVLSRTKKFIEIFYFTDENITAQEFTDRLKVTEAEMWHLVKINSKSIRVIPSKETLPDKIIGVTDILINLVGLFLKISTRIPMGKIGKEELNELIRSTTFGSEPAISTKTFDNLSVNQAISLEINNSKEQSS